MAISPRDPDQQTFPLSDEQRLAWLRLIRSENVGPATFKNLIGHFGSAQRAIEAAPNLSRRGGRAIRIASRPDAERELEAATRAGIRFVGMGEPDYPPWLRHADAPPPLLSVRGSVAGLTRPAVAIVGARNASVAGRKMAFMLARDLGEAGLLVVSGLARGIDSSAHEASIRTGTVAVFAGGADVLYPPENAGLLAAILEHDGAAISEMPIGWEPRARDFPRRNRIIAGMTLATVVVEAAERSGSLITARLALEQNREVMAVPGSPIDPRAGGSNGLLKQGARLVTEARDVTEALAPLLGRFSEPASATGEFSAPDIQDFEPADTDRDRLYEALGPTPVGLDDIIRFTGLAPRTVQVLLLELDLAGRVERHPGSLISLR
ncbi:DNA processing protein [Faunimonas pinastri]|uniref:DNA processing protein n=1 Tax=Faunimonas pinastri TaxID=1855383 RepID=A0A1H9CFJ6_9HYPH|nr:DNA-processing protein DprA [Faunimonas pinastri]SEP99924.1 DNA processing protein [Faunimonas pinastri]